MALEGVHDASVEIEKQLPSMVTITDRKSENLSVFPPINHEGLHLQPPKPPDSSSSSPWSSSSSSSFSSLTSISVDSDDPERFEETFLPPDSTKECRLAADCINQSPQLDARVQISVCGWLGFGLEILRLKIWNSTCSIPGHGSLVAAFRSFPLMSTMTAVYVGSLVLKWLRLRCSRQHKINTLMGVIREKDEKIVKLLDQIARLNQVLLSHQKS